MPTTAHQNWRNDRGDETLIFNYPLNENSFIIELGGFQGLWTKRMLEKFNCNILTIEPIPSFFNKMNNFLSNVRNEKLILENCAVSTTNKQIELFVSEDASSAHQKVGKSTMVNAYTLDYILNKYQIEKVDLMQVNIEGEEYPLFENWITSDVLKKFKFIQIQFHTFVENHFERRNKIQEGLKLLGFKNKFNYDFVWESWENEL